jgi:hypothetical protein
MRMKTKTNSVLAVYRTLLTVCILIAPLLSCSFFGIADYELTVTLKDGVQGTPENGQHSYKDLTVVEYKYSPLNSLCSVEVIYEGSRLAASGSITMYTNVALEARLIDIRDIWKITFSYTDTTITAITFKIDFSGSDVLSGTFTDDRGYDGTWDASNGKIKITYANWKNYVLDGTSLFNMSGTWTGESKTGTWSATRE